MGFFMKNIQWTFLIYAVAAIVSLIGLGVSLSFQNLFVNLLFLGLFLTFMGLGFARKKKLQNAENE